MTPTQAPPPPEHSLRARYFAALSGPVSSDWAIQANLAHAGRRPADLHARFSALTTPDALTTLQQFAQLHHELGDPLSAEGVLCEVLRRAPDTPAALTNHGLMLSQLGRPAEAVARQRQALALDPLLAAAWNNLGIALRALGAPDEAAAAEHRARQLAPDSPAAHINAGLALQAQGRLSEAITCFRHALGLHADLPEAWINLGIALLEASDCAGACHALRRALELAPGEQRATANLLMSMQYDEQLDSLTLRETARELGALWQRSPTALPRRASTGKLRVGYLGGDFRQHPVGWLIAPVLAAHDRAAFEIHLFDTRPHTDPQDALAHRLRASADQLHAVAALDDAALCALIRAQGIDVLVDLAGHTEHSRLGVVAQRAAPVQLSWLGYFGSTGLREMDAVVIGSGIASDAAASYYTEALEVLPCLHFAYAPPDYAPAPVAPPSASLGHIRFGCFNNPAKLNDEVIALWAQVLVAVPDSQLILKWKCFADPQHTASIRARFTLHGIDPARIELRPASSHPDMLAEYGDIDIALDPFPFSGALSTLEALWMGVPVITLPWLRPVSRQTLAILQTLDLTDLAAPTPRAFVELARRLADDLPRRQQLRFTLRERMQHSGLLDGLVLTRALEALYTRRCIATLEPRT